MTTTTLDACVLDTPVGPLSLIADGDVVVASGFVADPTDLHVRLSRERLTRHLRMLPDLGAVTKPVVAYFDGDVHAIDDVAVEQSGTPGQLAVWDALRAIPVGETRSYGDVAATVGTPTATRAVGSACGRNLVALIVPCHRVVLSSGGPGGYFYGLPVKEWLLAHERRHAGAR